MARLVMMSRAVFILICLSCLIGCLLFYSSFSWKNEKLVNLVNFQDDQSALNPSLDVHSGLRPRHSPALNKSSSYIHDNTEYRMEGRSLEHCDVLQYSAIESTKVMPPPKYQLSGVAVVTRHGDRSSLNQFPNHKRPNILCRLSSVTNHHRTAASKFIKSMDKLVAAQNRPSHYREFDPYPDSKHCGIAQLTARGVLQMISLGEQLRARYVGDGLLFQGKTNVAKKLYVRTTNYERTFQSALAVMHGFLPSISMSSVSMDVTKNLYHCSELYSNFSCSCPMAFQSSSLADKNPQATDDEKRLLRTNVQKVAPFLTDSLRPAPLLESLLPYVCHNLTFPCFNGSCVTWQTINTLWNITDSQEIRHAKSNHSALSSRLLAHPLLSEIVARFFNIMRYNTQKHAKRFFLFSGHDSTLLPLLQALSIMDGRRPPLASSLVFELYGVRQKQFYIRILYNGRDWTEYLLFCPTSTLVDGLCPMDNFAYFVLYENEKYFGKSYANACA